MQSARCGCSAVAINPRSAWHATRRRVGCQTLARKIDGAAAAGLGVTGTGRPPSTAALRTPPPGTRPLHRVGTAGGPAAGRIPEVVMQEPVITVSGNVGGMPRTRVVASGSVVTDFRI